MKLNARELRMTSPDAQFAKQIKRNPIFIVLDNVLDTYNVGAIFRLADAVAAQKVYLCGATETPPNSKIKKASINTWAWVEWEYCSTAKYAVEQCRMQPCLPAGRNAECRIVTVEQDKRSVPFYKAEYQMPLALVVGNETTGVSKDILEVADTIVELPMWGVNKSLNVMVSCSIVLYEIMKQTLRV